LAAYGLDGEAQHVLVVVTTLDLDSQSDRYKKRLVETLSSAARDFVLRKDRVEAFRLLNRPKEWRRLAKTRRPRPRETDAASIAAT
jgi:hypothetical protein